MILVNTHFIALIHPIQWTIAYPVGADRPAKRQKKTSCVSTGQVGPMLCTRQMACRTSFLSRQHDIIASFSFGAHAVYKEFFIRNLNFSLYFFRVCKVIIIIVLRGVYRPFLDNMKSSL